MTWTRNLIVACSLLATATIAPAQEAISGRNIDKPQRSTDPVGFYRANDVIGMTVRGNNGEDLGKIQDIVIDSRSGEVQYFLLDPVSTVKVDGVLVMPWTYVVREFQARPQVEYITVDLPRERLVRAPVIQQTQLRSFRTAAPVRIFQQVDQFYGITRNVLRPNLDGRDGRRDRGNRRGDRDSERGDQRRDDDRNRSDRSRPGDSPSDRDSTNPTDRPQNSDGDSRRGSRSRTEADAKAEAGTKSGTRKSDDASDPKSPSETAPRPGTEPQADPKSDGSSGTQPTAPSSPKPGSADGDKSPVSPSSDDDSKLPAPAESPGTAPSTDPVAPSDDDDPSDD